MAVNENDFSVMTLNIRFGLAQDGDNSWQNREPLFAQVLKRYPASFFGVQEANHFQTRFLAKNLCDNDFIGWHNRSKEWWQSNLIFYHKSWECLEHKHFFLSETPDVESKLPGSKWPRQFVVGLFQKGSNRVVMANTHFDFQESVQEKSATLAIRFLSRFPKDCPVIITGDFNSNPGGRAYAVFKGNGFVEAFDNNNSTTFHNFTGQATLDHIDWILYRGNLKLIGKKIIMDSFSGRYPSDHYPVTAAFSII
ncbi:MAG: endonuclease/exonuclease/phosphatase family protein [Proteobacteria bacterium]|nr:endonuclease/exonuclease/phosphatase family protein [Pseudomonadota bacterium]MBU2627658.1 endonuclease/exonuclease/phosphatase family protein [Pseudomonadota bacterium]